MAQRANFDTVVIDQEGNALEGIEVFFYLPGTETETTVYEQKTAGAPLTNPYETDATGNVNFWFSEPVDVAFHDPELEPRISDRTFEASYPSGSDAGTSLDALDFSTLDNTQFVVSTAGDSLDTVAITGDVTVSASTGASTVNSNTVGADELKDDEITLDHMNPAKIQVKRSTSSTNLPQNSGEVLICTWPVSFGDTNYTVATSVKGDDDAEGRLSCTIRAKTATAVTVWVYNTAPATVNDYFVELIGIHD